jgi:hypothetical protein
MSHVSYPRGAEKLAGREGRGERQRQKQPERERERETDRQTDTQTDIQRERPTERERESERGRLRVRHRDSETENLLHCLAMAVKLERSVSPRMSSHAIKAREQIFSHERPGLTLLSLGTISPGVCYLPSKWEK